MLINQAYEAGKKIKKAIVEKNGDIKIAVHKLQNVKASKHDLAHEYLDLCLKYDVRNVNNFMVDMLAETTDSEDVYISLSLGIMSEDEQTNDWITLKKAAEMWEKNDSTLRRVIKGPKFTENVDYKKEGRDWKISKSAMERVYGEKKRG